MASSSRTVNIWCYKNPHAVHDYSLVSGP